MYDYSSKNNNEYHQVGQFWTHFHRDMDIISEALFAAGYKICRTTRGDMIIMRKGDYDEEEIFELNEDEIDDEDEDGDGGITHFPKEY